MRIFIRQTAIALFLVSGCSPSSEPLDIRQAQPGQQQAVEPSLSVIGGRLAISEEGKSRLPYNGIDIDAGCVAAWAGALLILLPLEILAGGSLGSGPDCGQYLPRLFLVQLESRRAAALQVLPDGGFIAQVPPGTYLVTVVVDDPIPVWMAFQASQPSRAYYLGNVAIDYRNGWGANDVISLKVTDDTGPNFETLTGTLASTRPLSLETQLMTRLSSGAIAPRYEANWNTYLSSAIAELHGKGMKLLTEQPTASPGQGREEIEAVAMLVRAYEQKRHAVEEQWAKKIDEIKDVYCRPSWSNVGRCRNYVAKAEVERDAELKALDEARAKAVAAAATVPAESASAPPARVERRLEARGPDACTVVGQPASEADYQAVRQDLDECWQARIAVAQGLCDKNFGPTGPPCYRAEEAKKYRDAAMAAFDAGWKQRTAL